MNLQCCPKCNDSYFTLEISWLDTLVKTKYTCENCNWSVVTSSCTSSASAPDLSCSNQSVTSSTQVQ
jgi:hypothetical protein